MDLILKAALGAAVVIILAMLAKTKNYYIAGLVPLFPTFALIAHYIVGKGRSVDDLKTTIVFGMWSIIPYFVYLAALYVLVDRMRLEASLALAAVAWLMAATVLVRCTDMVIIALRWPSVWLHCVLLRLFVSMIAPMWRPLSLTSWRCANKWACVSLKRRSREQPGTGHYH